MPKIFTDNHYERMQAAYDALEKAFDGFVIIALASDNDNHQEAVTHRFKGGYVQALGMVEEFKKAEYAKHVADELEQRG